MFQRFTTWGSVQRQQAALLRALAQWQRTPTTPLGRFGLSLTTDFTTRQNDILQVQFHLHHKRGGILQSGVVAIELARNPEIEISDDLTRAVSSITMPFLREFLLPSGMFGHIQHVDLRRSLAKVKR